MLTTYLEAKMSLSIKDCPAYRGPRISSLVKQTLDFSTIKPSATVCKHRFDTVIQRVPQ